MKTSTLWQSRTTLIACGLIIGVAISAVDNFAFHGEVSPIVIVGLLFVATSTAGILWGWRGSYSAVGTWLCLPAAHLMKHALGLPDTLQPNTYTSIVLLALFTLAVASIGFVLGASIRGRPSNNTREQ